MKTVLISGNDPREKSADVVKKLKAGPDDISSLPEGTRILYADKGFSWEKEDLEGFIQEGKMDLSSIPWYKGDLDIFKNSEDGEYIIPEFLVLTEDGDRVISPNYEGELTNDEASVVADAAGVDFVWFGDEPCEEELMDYDGLEAHLDYLVLHN